MKKKILAGILSLAMVFTLMPSTMVSAEEANTSQTKTQAESEQAYDSEVIEALQSRINALPTVDEFIAMADGTTVEDSTLNQAQLDVYNEAQAIAEEMDKLTDEEQGQLDTGKLEALFEYFNGMTEETALTPGSTVTLTSSTQYIEKAGTYNIKAASGISASKNLLYIRNTSASDNIVINIQGNITISDSNAIINVTTPCNLTINGNGHTIKNTGSSNVVRMEDDSATVHLSNCNFTSNTGLAIGQEKGTLYIESGYYKRTGTTGQVIASKAGTLYIQGGTIENAGTTGTSDTVAILGKLYMTGGTIISPNSAAVRAGTSGASMSITGGTIKNSLYGVYVKENNPTCTIGNVTFSGNTNDVYLGSGQKFTLSTDYKGADKIKVGVVDTISANTQRQITTTSTDQSMLAKVTSANSAYTVNYDTSGKYLYMWKHSHTWTYSASGNKVTAKCTSDSSCGYASGLTLTLTAPDMTYTGSAYNKASIANDITSATGATAGSITYYSGSTKLSSAPVNAGTYTAKVTIGGATATADFTINKVEVTKPSADETKFVYNESSQTYNVAASDKYTVTGNARIDAGTQTVTVALNDKTNYKWSDGSTDDLTFTFTIAKADLNLSLALKNWIYGRTPSKPELGNYKGDGAISYFYKKQGEADTEYKSITEADFNTILVGKYTLKASVAEGTNYNAATAECDFAVTKQPITVSVSMDGWTYGEEAKTPSVTVKAEDSDITSSYEKSQITYTYYTDSECKNEAVPNNAGTYYVKAKVEATDNYSDGSVVAEFTIAKKAVTATVTADNKTYDGTTDAVVNAVISNDDLISGDSITIKGIIGTFDNKNAGTDKKVTVDNSKAEYAGTGVENYDITIGTEAKASINKLTAEFRWSNTDLTYTGSEQGVTAEVKNAISGDKFTLTYDGNKQTVVGSYTAEVTALGNDNYELPSEENAKTAWKISYLTAGTVTVSGTKGDNDWYVTKVTITPETGYEISANGKDWTNALEYDAQGSQKATYYLRETATGFISDKKTAEFKIDTELPEGDITIKNNSIKAFLNTITFNHFFKNTVDVTITGADATSGIAKIEYQKVAKGASFDKDGTWTAGKSFSMTANDKSAIYARITDNAGNYAIINSDGIVVYTDATATAEETFTKTSKEDITTGITVNGNTIASVMAKKADDENAVTTQVDASNYEIKDDKLVLKASYLQTLAAGKYTLTVSYNPYGEAYVEDSKNEAPDTSVITLTVVKAEGSITKISDISKVYDGNAVTAPTFTTTNGRGTDDANVTIKYKKQGADDSTYTSEAPANSGDYVVRITVKSDEDYDVVSATEEFSISRKEMTASAEGYTGTYDGQVHGITVNVTDPKISTASNVKVVYGTKDADGKITYSEKPVTYKDAGEYTVYYKVSADNYNDAKGSAVVKIAPKTVSLVWPVTEFTYDGKTHKPSANVKADDVISPDSVEVTVSGEQTNAGSYTAQAVALSSNNYVLSSDITASFKINKAAATVTVDNAAKHIGKADPKFTYKVTGLADGDELDGITILRAAGEDAGSYDIMATVKADANPNYDVTCVAGKLTIEDHIKAKTPVVENRVEATCTKDGSYDEVYYCTVKDCKAELERVHKTIQATGHKYGEPEFTWSKDYSSTTATFTCENDKTHVETVEATVTSETVAATCETAGKTVYTATAEFEGQTYTDSKEVAIKALGHKYGNPVFNWNADYSVATATFTCTHDDTHVEMVVADIASKSIAATCTADGKTVYTATVEFDGKTYTDTKETAISATGHKYGNPVFTWNDDYSAAEATFTCVNDKSHVETVKATVTSETVDPTCETAGKITYTATAEFNGKTYTDSKETVIGATGHDYADPVFKWSDDHSTAKATFTCKNDKTHVLVKDCEVTAESVDATCTTAGKVTYTASVIVAGKTYTDTKVVNGTALGHKYGTPVFTWNDDYSTAEATFTCANDKTHVETVKATVTSETVDPTCETAGKTTYTATVEFNGKNYTDSKEVAIKAIGHKYGKPVFTWNADKATAAFTCANDKAHVETVEAKVTSKTTDATCTAAGKTVYTATVEFDGKTYTDTNTVEIKAKGHTAVKDAAKAPTCTETGLTEGSHCAVCGEVLVAQETVLATGHSWSDWNVTKEATATEAGRKESTCTVCGIKRYEVIPATGVPTEDPSNGKLDKDVQVAPTAPVKEAAMTNTKAELLEAPNIFKDEEKTLIKEGKVDAKVWMEINETDVESIPQDTKAQVEKEAEKIMGDQASDIMYFDADLFKQVTDVSTGDVIAPKEAIHEPGEHIDVTVKIPEKLLIDESKKSMVREYKIIRIHTDQTTGKDIVDVLDGDFNEETGEFSFATDKFSTYAIAFTDVPIEVSISDNGDNSTITAIGDTKQLTAVVTPDSAAKRDVEWTSSDTSVATVDENGVLTAVGNGNAVIRVTVADSDVYAEYTVRVNVPAKDTPDTPTTPSKPGKPGSTSNPAAPVAKPDTKPATPNKDSKTSTKKTAVKTGDENRTWLLIMMMFAGAGMVVFGRKKKENR